jgi:hypothetical protein
VPEDNLDAAAVQYAQLALYVHDRDIRFFDAVPRRSELVLAEAGLSIGAIATLTGKKYETVKTTLRRARESAAKEPKG